MVQIESIEELLSAAQVGSSIRKKIRKDFPSWSDIYKKQFKESLEWGIIQDLANRKTEISQTNN